MASRRILVIDDEQDILDYLVRELRGKLDVLTALGGSEAIARFEEKEIDLVLTDVRMPGIDGIQILKTIKQLSPNCEVLLMSGYTDTHVLLNALNEGAFAFVTKPLIRDVLINRINHAIAVIQARENKDEVLQELKSDLLMQSKFANRLSALAAMAGGIAHELHQPLSGISIYSGTIKRMMEKNNAINGDYLKETMIKIDKQIERATGVIEHIREFSSGKVNQETERMNLEVAVKRSMELFNIQLKTHDIDLDIDIQKDLYINADRNIFEQVIINLISNAKDSLLEGSPESKNRQKSIHIRGYLDDSWIKIDIKDTGSGIPKEMIDTMFEPFSTSKQALGGSGLGLFICRRVLEDYGAKIEFISTGPEGSTLRLCFPND